MNRTEAARAIRAYLGDRLVPHDEWGSIVDYSAIVRTDHDPCDRLVAHYNGATAQLPRIRRNAAAHGDREAEAIQMRYVDNLHYNGRGWTHGFAYCGMIGPLTGLFYEARSRWYPHGAHFNDADKSDFPLYFAFGRDDTALTEPQKEGWYRIRGMLGDLFGVTAVSDHGSIPGNSTACAGQIIRDFIYAPPVVASKPSDALIDWFFGVGLSSGDPAYWKALPADSPEWASFIKDVQRGIIGWWFKQDYAHGDPHYWLNLDPASPEWSALWDAVGDHVP